LQSSCVAAVINFARLPSRCPAPLLRSRDHVRHFRSPFGRSEPQIFYQQRQINAILLGCLNSTTGARMPQPILCADEFLFGQRAPLFHAFILVNAQSKKSIFFQSRFQSQLSQKI
jgi:hypothetical protein